MDKILIKIDLVTLRNRNLSCSIKYTALSICEKEERGDMERKEERNRKRERERENKNKRKGGGGHKSLKMKITEILEHYKNIHAYFNYSLKIEKTLLVF